MQQKHENQIVDTGDSICDRSVRKCLKEIGCIYGKKTKEN